MATMVGLYVEFKAKSNEVDQTFKKMQGEIDKLKGKQKDITSGFGSMVGRVKELGMSILNFGKWVAIGISAAAAGVWVMMNHIAESIDKVTDSARGLGIGAGDLQKLAFAAKQSGVEFDSLEMALSKMNLTLASVFSGSTKLQGLDVSGLKGMDTDEQFVSIVKALEGMTDKSAQASAAFEIFGKSYKEVLKIARDKGLLESIKDFQNLGLAITDSQRVAVDAFGDSQNKLSAIWQGFTQKVVAYAAEPFAKMIDWISDTITEMGGIDSAAQKFAKAIVEAVRWAVNGLNSLVNMIDGLYARMLKIQIFAKETANNAPDPLAITKAIGEKYGVLEQGGAAQRQLDRSTELPNLYKQLAEVEKNIEARKDFLKPLVDTLDTEKNKIGTALDSYIEPITKANKATTDFASAATDATKKVNSAIESMTEQAGQDKLKKALGLNKENTGSQAFDNQIKDIYLKSVLGTGGTTQTGIFNGQEITNKVSTAADDIKSLEADIRAKYANDSGNLIQYLGAINELKTFVSKMEPSQNKVKVDIEVKAEDGFLVKVTQSGEFENALAKGLNAALSGAARMGAK